MCRLPDLTCGWITTLELLYSKPSVSLIGHILNETILHTNHAFISYLFGMKCFQKDWFDTITYPGWPFGGETWVDTWNILNICWNLHRVLVCKKKGMCKHGLVEQYSGIAFLFVRPLLRKTLKHFLISSTVTLTQFSSLDWGQSLPAARTECMCLWENDAQDLFPET